MRVLAQRVSSACVTVDRETVGEIGPGLLLLTGFGAGDGAAVVSPMADKVCSLRIFEDRRGRFQHSVNDLGGGILVVPQFTLYADTQRGRRPDFSKALAPGQADVLFEEFVGALAERATGEVARGRFGMHMSVQLVNDGPVTLLLERS